MALLLAVTALGACGGEEPAVGLIPVTTQAPRPAGPVACPAALAIGTLVADPRWGIALRSPEGDRVTKVVWPHGYVGRRTATGIELLDDRGRIVGVVGGQVELGGGFGPDDAFYPCG